jgi:hypothetical protein
LAPKLKKLPKEKLDFLLGQKTKGFAARPELLFKRFETKTPKEIEAYIDGMMSVVEQSRFHPGKDEAAIPLNTQTEGALDPDPICMLSVRTVRLWRLSLSTALFGLPRCGWGGRTSGGRPATPTPRRESASRQPRTPLHRQCRWRRDIES